MLVLLNSKLINFIHRYKYLDLEKDLFQKILIANCKQFPIKKISLSNQKPFIEKADQMLALNKDLQELTNKFQNYLKQKFQLRKLSKKLQNWHELEFGNFIKELNKAIKTSHKIKKEDGIKGLKSLEKKDEFEWMDLFEDNKQKAQALQTKINQTDAVIDQMVYALYGLTEEEISIVENS